ncbi:glycerophosphoryl diester phosphodiesterase membrane domain-containing protein [Streptomyces sp. NPDC059637]|uniref:glycerophosphoryl diester phosphodiesterase membrane domain-containing protein n=1 Tax=Streptomyces sp. NPDC059637 TaxID=3347752 RepID=UPI0036AE680F
MTDTPGWAPPGSPEDPQGGDARQAGAPEAAPENPHAAEPAAGGEPSPGTGPGTNGQGTKWSENQPPRADWHAPGRAGTPPPGATGPGQGWGGGQSQGWGQGWGNGQNQGWGQGPGRGPAWDGRPPAAKPGVVPLRPLGLGEILDGSVSTLRAHWRTVLGISLVVSVVTQAALGVASWWTLNDLADRFEEFEASAATSQAPSFGEVMALFTGVFTTNGVAALVQLVSTCIATALLTMVVSRAVLGRPVSTGLAWQEARPRLGAMFGLTLLLTLLSVGVLGVGAVPGVLLLVAGNELAAAGTFFLGMTAAFFALVWLMIRYSLAVPALMLEKQGILKAMSRSARLVRGSWWRVFGVLVLTGILTSIVVMIVSMPFSLFSMAANGDSMTDFLNGGAPMRMSAAAVAISGVGGVIGYTITLPINAGVTTLLYVDQRIRREALDLELARAAGVPGYGDDNGAEAPPAGA